MALIQLRGKDGHIDHDLYRQTWNSSDNLKHFCQRTGAEAYWASTYSAFIRFKYKVKLKKFSHGRPPKIREVPPLVFVEYWQTAKNWKQFLALSGMKRATAANRYQAYRRRGVPLIPWPRWCARQKNWEGFGFFQEDAPRPPRRFQKKQRGK